MHAVPKAHPLNVHPVPYAASYLRIQVGKVSTQWLAVEGDGGGEAARGGGAAVEQHVGDGETRWSAGMRRKKPRRGLKIQEDVEPCLQGKEVS
ncbi:hypothetical protein E3N88_34212 [Mikania micrantha]|uniref:Uncharacterized protein n=1 Tax=Mikania micrantha TaxID=192012 RepID=A0A5N6M057_9ASTR|nr:hypothetical protein E3N88_34212 [Mikania micrantha]